MRVVVLADTHAPRRWKACPPAVAACAARGGPDPARRRRGTAGVLDELAGYAPVLAVRGNNDGRDVAAWGAPDRLETEIDGIGVAMVHDSGPASGRPPGCATGSRRGPGRLRALPHPDGPCGARPADLQPRISHRPAAAAPRHGRPPGHRRRPPDPGPDRRRYLNSRFGAGAGHGPAGAAGRETPAGAARPGNPRRSGRGGCLGTVGAQPVVVVADRAAVRPAGARHRAQGGQLQLRPWPRQARRGTPPASDRPT